MQKRYLSAIVIIALTSVTILNGCSATSRKSVIDNKNERTVGVNSSVLYNFDETKNWIAPNSSSYSSGLSSVITPKVPSAFEQSVCPENGVACIYVSRVNGLVGKSNPIEKDWTQEIQYNDYSFEINGQTYSVPVEYKKQQMLLLPIDKGIVWAPVQRQPPDMSRIQQALQGTTDIFYTPYNIHGGSLANGKQLIAQLPHRWMGLDGAVIASAWTGWLPKNKVAMAHVKSDTIYHLEFTKNDQIKSVSTVQDAVPGWTTLFMRNLVKPAYYQKPPYAAYIQSLTRTHGGFVLEVNFVDATLSGRNAGMSAAIYYWSEQTGKWTPLTQNYTVQTLVGWTDIGSNGVYWVQPCKSGNALDVSEMHFDPTSLTIESIWLGNWFYGESFVDGNSWVVVLPDDMPNSASDQPKKWSVYTP